MSLILTSTISCSIVTYLKSISVCLLNKLAAFEVSTFNGYGFGSAFFGLESWTVLIQALSTIGSAFAFKSMNQYFKDRYYNEPGVTTPDVTTPGVLNLFRTPFQFYMINQVWIRPFNEIRDYISTDFEYLCYFLRSKEGAYYIIAQWEIAAAEKNLESDKTDRAASLKVSTETKEQLDRSQAHLLGLIENLKTLKIDLSDKNNLILSVEAELDTILAKIKTAKTAYENMLEEGLNNTNSIGPLTERLERLQVELQRATESNPEDTNPRNIQEIDSLQVELQRATESNPEDTNPRNIQEIDSLLKEVRANLAAAISQEEDIFEKGCSELEAEWIQYIDNYNLKLDSWNRLKKAIQDSTEEENTLDQKVEQAKSKIRDIQVRLKDSQTKTSKLETRVAKAEEVLNELRASSNNPTAAFRSSEHVSGQVTTFELAKGTFVYLMRALKLICTTNIQTRAEEGHLNKKIQPITDDKGLKYFPGLLNWIGLRPTYRYFVRPLAFLGLFLILINLPITILCIINKAFLLSVDFLYSLVFKTTLSLTLMHFLYVIMTLLELVSYIRLVYRKLNEEFKNEEMKEMEKPTLILREEAPKSPLPPPIELPRARSLPIELPGKSPLPVPAELPRARSLPIELPGKSPLPPPIELPRARSPSVKLPGARSPSVKLPEILAGAPNTGGLPCSPI